MASTVRLKGRVALVTGAASGIGRALAVALVGRGCHLALADLDEAGLADAARSLAAPGVTLSTHRLDVADRAAIAALVPEIQASHGGLDVLVNNAGVALGGTFEEISAADFDWLLAINFGGVVAMTRAFLPLLRRSDEARLVNVSSVFGLIAPPGQTAYCASKFAVRGFSESLRHELAGSTVGVTVVHPGGVATSIARHARVPAGVDAAEAERRKRMFENALVLSPTVAGEAIARALERRQPRVVIGRDAKLASAIERVLPVSYWRLLAKLSGTA